MKWVNFTPIHFNFTAFFRSRGRPKKSGSPAKKAKSKSPAKKRAKSPAKKSPARGRSKTPQKRAKSPKRAQSTGKKSVTAPSLASRRLKASPLALQQIPKPKTPTSTSRSRSPGRPKKTPTAIPSPAAIRKRIAEIASPVAGATPPRSSARIASKEGNGSTGVEVPRRRQPYRSAANVNAPLQAQLLPSPPVWTQETMVGSLQHRGKGLLGGRIRVEQIPVLLFLAILIVAAASLAYYKRAAIAAAWAGLRRRR